MVCLLWTKVVRIPCYVGEIYGRPTVSLILLVNYHFATYRSLVGLYISEIKCQLIGLSHLTIYYHHHHCRRRHHQDKYRSIERVILMDFISSFTIDEKNR